MTLGSTAGCSQVGPSSPEGSNGLSCSAEVRTGSRSRIARGTFFSRSAPGRNATVSARAGSPRRNAHTAKVRDGAGNQLDQDGKRAIRSAGQGRSGQIYGLAHETVFIDWDTAGLPRQAASAPSAAANARPPVAVPPPIPFDQTFESQGIGFRVTSANIGPRSKLKIAPLSLSLDNTPIVQSIEGPIVRAEVTASMQKDRQRSTPTSRRQSPYPVGHSSPTAPIAAKR